MHKISQRCHTRFSYFIDRIESDKSSILFWYDKHFEVARDQSFDVITARKRSLGQGYIFTDECLSTGGGTWSMGGLVLGMGGCLVRGWYLVLGRVPGPGVPGPGEGCLVPGWVGMETPPMATAAGSTHPTGMQWDCLITNFGEPIKTAQSWLTNHMIRKWCLFNFTLGGGGCLVLLYFKKILFSNK